MRQGLSTAVERTMLFDTAMYLAGDSYPKCARIEAVVREHCAPMFGTWLGHQDIAGMCRFDGNIGTVSLRADRLARLMEAKHSARSIVLFGRSSGARVSTLVSERTGAVAVVCLGYPFRHPKRDREPERVAHLAATTTPTLILQGRADEYGGEADLGNYELSPAVQTRIVDGGHDLRLSRAEWDRAIEAVRSFLVSVHSQT